VRDTLGLPVKAAKPLHVQAFDAAMDPAFAVAVGLVVWGYNREVGEGGRPPQSGGSMPEWFSKATAWLKNFLP
jgi:hypothetical protein